MVPAAVSTPRSPCRAPARILGALTALVTRAALAAGPVSAAGAAPPPNDSPSAPGSFQPYTAENGKPSDLQAIAELAEATPDAGVPQCLGPASFARTVWYVIPAAETPHEITVEASGQTIDVLDLAVFVQPADATAPLTVQPNACSGVGAGGANAAEEPTSGISVRVPAGRSVLVQVGRRGPVGSSDDERAVVSLDGRAIVPSPASPPPGDAADFATPLANTNRDNIVSLFGATLTEEDPAQPPCPSLGSVWRKVVPSRAGPRLISAVGNEATTLTVFAGRAPRGDNALDCIDRVGRGSLQMLVQGKARQPLWIRLGTDQPPDGSTATLRVDQTPGAFVVDGGPGGFDPTPGGPGGGLPPDCAKADAARASIRGTPFRGTVKQLNKRRFLTLALVVNRGPVCDVAVSLIGPRGRAYASARTLRLKGGRQLLRLGRTTPLAKGAYRLQVTALSRLGDHVRVRTTLRGQLK
jgi:hypothetical protein